MSGIRPSQNLSNLLLIGDSTGTSTNTKTNIFDNLSIGIRTEKMGIIIRNCAFQKGWINPAATTANPAHGFGIYDSISYGHPINIGTATGTLGNAFWNMHYAIRTADCYNVTVTGTAIKSTQSITDTVKLLGKWGIVVRGRDYDNINISSNNIYNIANGITVNNSDVISATSSSTSNSIIVYDNRIRPLVSTVLTPSTQYVKNAITILSSVTANNSGAAIPIVCSNNDLLHVFNGIFYIPG